MKHFVDTVGRRRHESGAVCISISKHINVRREETTYVYVQGRATMFAIRTSPPRAMRSAAVSRKAVEIL